MNNNDFYKRLKEANAGDVSAQYEIGAMYANGRGIEKDDAAAVEWYRKAADQGHSKAQYCLGYMYDRGFGVSVDDVSASSWYKKAADQGHVRAQFCMGWFCANGRGVPKNEKLAAEWYRTAAESGDQLASFYLAELYEQGRGVVKSLTEAAQWYKLAAERGHEKANERLAVLHPEMEKDTRHGKSTSRPNAQTNNASETNSEPPTRHSEASFECKVLLDACTPELYDRNAFRIIGLPVNASARDIKRRIDDIKSAEEMGDAATEHGFAYALNPPPTLEQIRETAQKLQDPDRRLVDEFFWFWPGDWNLTDDRALLALSNRDKDAAFKFWHDIESKGNETAAAVATHNLAIMYHLTAIQGEQVAIAETLDAKTLAGIDKYWRSAFKRWEALSENEAFWSHLTQRIRQIDDPRLTTGFARRLRACLPEAMDKINGLIAVRHAEAGNYDLARTHVTYMKETHTGADNVPKVLASVAAPLEQRVISAVQLALKQIEARPASGDQYAEELLQAVKVPLAILETILEENDHHRIDVFDSVAEACLECQIAYSRATKDWPKALAILESAVILAGSDDTRERIEANLATIREKWELSEYLDPIVDTISRIDKYKQVLAKLHAVQTELLPCLISAEKELGKNNSAYIACADFIAKYLRGLSVATYNESSDVELALSILQQAISVARGDDVKEQLKKDQAQLSGIQAEANKHNLLLQIRGDSIEINRNVVRYNKQTIQTNKVQGVKFGVFAQYTNGVQSSVSYLVDVHGAGTFISIECKRFFRDAAQAHDDYGKILDALLHQIVPGLVTRLAESIVDGSPLHMGDARIVRNGIYVTTGSLMWKKEQFIPWTEVRHVIHQGHLNISSSKNARLTASFALRDVWNAAIFEYVAKATLEISATRPEAVQASSSSPQPAHKASRPKGVSSPTPLPKSSSSQQRKQPSTRQPSRPSKRMNPIVKFVVIPVSVVFGFLVIGGLFDSSGSTSHRSNRNNVSAYTPPPKPAFNQPALSLPLTGSGSRYHTTEAVAPLEIVTRAGSHYFVKLVDYYTDRLILTVFVRGGDTTQFDVPLGSYKLKYASGSTWYGDQHLFGPNTSYSKAEDRFDFKVIGNQVSGYTVELFLRQDGNLETTNISANEF